MSDLLPPVWFALLALLVLGPLIAPGYLLLLDAPAGPTAPWPSWIRLPSQGLINPSVPFDTLTRALGAVSPTLPNKALIAGCVFAGGLGLFRFATRWLGLDTWAGALGGTLFAINPFVYERLIAGQLTFAAGCALLPWILPSLIRLGTAADTRDLLKAVMWFGAAMAVNVHIAGMVLFLLLAAVLASPARAPKKALWGLAALFAAAGLSLYWSLSPLLSPSDVVRLGIADVRTYAPRPRGLGIVWWELALHGFWRAEFITPLRSNAPLFLVCFVPIAGLIVAGIVRSVRAGKYARPARALLLATLIALVLAMGTSWPPTGALARALYQRFPPYAIYREPQKWLALLVLLYAVFAAVGLDLVLRHTQRHGLRAAASTTSVLLVMASTPMLLWGFAGQVAPSHFPREWTTVDDMTATSRGSMLFLPWNLYAPLPFAGGRFVASPAEQFFSATTVVSNDPRIGARHETKQPDPRDRLVSNLVDGRPHPIHLGHVLAALNIRYVAVARIAGAADYKWVGGAVDDLTRVFHGRSVDLYENTAWQGPVYPLRADSRFAAEVDLLNDPAAQQRAATVLIASEPRLPSAPPSSTLLARLLGEPVAGPDGGVIGTDKSCADGWRLAGSSPVCHLGALAAFAAHGRQSLWRPGAIVSLAGYSGTIVAWWLCARGLRSLSRRRRCTTLTDPAHEQQIG